MREKKWTPGPWNVKNGYLVMKTRTVGIASTYPVSPEHDQQEANAHLIAESPNLFELLEVMLNIFDRGLPEDSVGRKVCDQAISALDAATGKK